jgi:hypothetical protein
LRSLNRESGELGAAVLEMNARHGVLMQPSGILRDFGRIHDEEIIFLPEAVGDEIVNHPATFIEEDRVLGMADWERGEIVGEQSIEPSRGPGATHEKLAHVGDIKDPAGFADGFVLLQDSGVLNGHFPACEFDHAAAGGKMLVEEWSSHRVRKL